MHSGVACLCDGKLDILYLDEMMNHLISVLFRFFSLSDGGRFLCVFGLRGHRVPVNLFLLHNWVITLVLRSLVRVTWSGWEWGCFKIYFGTCDLTFTFLFYVLG